MQIHSVRRIRQIIWAFAALGLAGCATSPLSRIDAKRALYESWPIEIQTAVYEGRAIKDMTPEMVRMALGEPSRIEPRTGAKNPEEVWIYAKNGGATSARSGAGGGGGGGARGRRGGGGGAGGGSRAGGGGEEIQVVFQDGVVTRVS